MKTININSKSNATLNAKLAHSASSNQHQASIPQHATRNTQHPSPFLPKRVGKIASLPGLIRDELNQRLDDGQPGPEILHWLNNLKATKQLLRDSFDNKPINKQNLSDWRTGGYAEWAMRGDLLDQASQLSEQSSELREQNGELLVDDLLHVFVARYAAMFLRWDGRVTGEFDSRLRLFTRMRRDLEHLQQSSHLAAHKRREQKELEDKDDRDKQEALRNWMAHPARRRAQLVRTLGEKEGNAAADRHDANDHSGPPVDFADGPDDWVNLAIAARAAEYPTLPQPKAAGRASVLASEGRDGAPRRPRHRAQRQATEPNAQKDENVGGASVPASRSSSGRASLPASRSKRKPRPTDQNGSPSPRGEGRDEGNRDMSQPIKPNRQSGQSTHPVKAPSTPTKTSATPSPSKSKPQSSPNPVKASQATSPPSEISKLKSESPEPPPPTKTIGPTGPISPIPPSSPDVTI